MKTKLLSTAYNEQERISKDLIFNLQSALKAQKATGLINNHLVENIKLLNGENVDLLSLINLMENTEDDKEFLNTLNDKMDDYPIILKNHMSIWLDWLTSKVAYDEQRAKDLPNFEFDGDDSKELTLEDF